MNLPVKFKYFTLDRGTVEPRTVGDLPFEGYNLTDDNGIIIASGTSIGALVAHAQNSDITRELAEQFVVRNLAGMEHLKDIDIDARPELPAGLLVPPGHGGGGPGMH